MTNIEKDTRHPESPLYNVVKSVQERLQEWEKRHIESPFSLYRARFNKIRAQLPIETSQSPGYGWLEWDATQDAFWKTFGSRLGDLGWNLTFGLVFGHEFRSPLYSSEQSKARMQDVVGFSFHDRSGDPIAIQVTPGGFHNIGS